MKKANKSAYDRSEDFEVYRDCIHDGPPYDDLYTGWKIHVESHLWRGQDAHYDDPSWDWEVDKVHLDLPEWCKEWYKIESKKRLHEQIELVRVKEKQFAMELLKKSMQRELEEIIKDYPAAKECYDSYLMIHKL